jgi:outer membrane immunogenic protein
MFRLSLVATTICLAFSFSTSALAAKTPSNEQLFEMVKALQSRVAVLEKQNAGYQRELISVQRDAEQPQLASLTRSADEPKPMRLANPTVGALQPEDNWSGMYFGASFGAGQTVASYVHDSLNGNFPQSATAGEDTNTGAVMDLFLGLNAQVRPRLVAGLQLEGSLAALDFDSDGLWNTSDITAQAEATWMASALARMGVLIRPNTMLYGLAGLTFAHFDVVKGDGPSEVTSFDAHGFSVGAGIEKKIGPDWSIRAEYRFTDFGETDESFLKIDGALIRDGEDRFDNKMHIGRIGISRKLGRSEPSAEALK